MSKTIFTSNASARRKGPDAMTPVYTVKVSDTIASAMNLDEKEVRQEIGIEAKALRSGYKITGTLEALEKLAFHMTRDSGWDMTPQAISACNRKAKEIRLFIAELKKAGAPT